MLIAYLFPLLICLFALLYIKATRNFDYWNKRNVRGPKPLAFFGNIGCLLQQKLCIGEFLRDMYRSFNEPFVGFFICDEPCLLICSPEIMKDIMIKDFSYFTDRAMVVPKHDPVFANLLFVQKGLEWKKLRANVTPIFSSGKIKTMFPQIKNIGARLLEFLRTNPGEHDVNDVLLNYTIDVIAKCFFGIDGQSFDGENAHFRKVADMMIKPEFANSVSQTMYFLKGKVASVLRLTFFDVKVQQFFVDTFLNTLKVRDEMKFTADDFITSLMKIKKNDPDFDDIKAAGLGLNFFIAGFEPSQIAISYTLYEMALNLSIQKKAREEILEILNCVENSQDVTYNTLMNMKYLNMCVMETVRKYPPLPFMDRKCVKDYSIPGSNLIIEKGTVVYLSPLAIQTDAKYFPEPDKYNPDRFKDEFNQNLLINIPFGSGPRYCIGKRFALIVVKLALVHILSNFEIRSTEDTPTTMKYEPKNFTLQPKGKLMLKFVEIQHT